MPFVVLLVQLNEDTGKCCVFLLWIAKDFIQLRNKNYTQKTFLKNPMKPANIRKYITTRLKTKFQY